MAFYDTNNIFWLPTNEKNQKLSSGVNNGDIIFLGWKMGIFACYVKKRFFEKFTTQFLIAQFLQSIPF